ncbi:hypothetical protein ACFL1J_02835 [Pseudomonadota bacterium]
MPSRLIETFRILASLKVAIPMLVILTAVTVTASLFPGPDLFRSWWYLGLLGALGLSLLLITIQHIPRILRRKGRNALIGVIVTHAGILVLIAAAIQGGAIASRWQFRAIEGEMTIVPGMPFVVELVTMNVEDYQSSDFPGGDLSGLPKKRQDSQVRIYRSGQLVAEFTAAPGQPGRHEGYTLLPSVSDIGWTFQLIVGDPRGRERTLLIRPWSDPTFDLAGERVLAHGLESDGVRQAQLLKMVEGQPQIMGSIGPGETLELNGHQFRLGGFRRYTGMSLYDRPHMPLLILGSLLMLGGLIWHFYHRYRD